MPSTCRCSSDLQGSLIRRALGFDKFQPGPAWEVLSKTGPPLCGALYIELEMQTEEGYGHRQDVYLFGAINPYLLCELHSTPEVRRFSPRFLPSFRFCPRLSRIIPPPRFR